ncbi:MAG: TlpA disulfide reductase family protein [Acidobacteria bacterium]|nr:TlpA disulfide reductase family protein [Acidobacteriota bacterium]MDA1235513.1 TlpA disulfide reductase family protein [Acidobacteriota bacterium]
MALSRKSAVSLGLTLLLAVVLMWRVAPYLRIYKVDAGDRAPGFELAGDNGAGARLEDYRGKYVLLNFWATWCPPCVQELPSLNTLHRELEPNGLVVLGISVDENKEAYEQFLDRFDVGFPTVRDPEMAVASRYGTNMYPETYLIDRDGLVVRKYIGGDDWMRPEIVNYLRSLL